MPVIIILALAAAAIFVIVTVLSVAVHLLFSPWLILAAAVALLAWTGTRRRRARR